MYSDGAERTGVPAVGRGEGSNSGKAPWRTGKLLPVSVAYSGVRTESESERFSHKAGEKISVGKSRTPLSLFSAA